MSNLTPTATFDNVAQLETTTVALGGSGAPMNVQAQSLLNRTQYLFVQASNLAAVASSGDYNSLIHLPALGTAAYQSSSAFATAAQGAKADGAAQAGSLSAIAFSGSYLDLSNKPALLVNPMTSVGDMIVGAASGSPSRVSAGVLNYVWTSNGPSTTPSWKPATGSGGSSIIPQYDFQRDFGGDPTFATDSTAAFQNALNTMAAAGGGELFMGYNAHYKISGALQDTSRGNAQILVPVPTSGASPFAITIRGGLPPSSLFSVGGSPPTITEGVIIESTMSSGTGSILGGWGASGTYGDFVFTRLTLLNLTFRTVANPTYTAVDLSHIAEAYLDGIVCDSGSYAITSLPSPTTSTSYGLVLPGNNNDAFTYLGTVNICGFYNGISVGEHTTGVMVAVWGCLNAYVFPFAYHASSFQRLMAVWCRNILVSSGVHYTRIGQLNIEHTSTGPFITVYDVNDPSNQIHGDLEWHAVLAGTGVDHTFTKSGGANIACTELGVNISSAQIVMIQAAASDEITAITTGTSLVTFRAPHAFTLTGVRASLSIASSSGLPTADIRVNGTSILSTKLSIDANEKTSTTAATPAVISASVINDDAEITIDLTVAGTGAKGLKIALIGTIP